MEINGMDNLKLSQLDIWKDKRCKICGRKYPQTLLNIEGYIHHGCILRCLDTKSCNKYRKKRGG
tara:strand:- start:560 stop:751 length:192 start_codon:yes stop_codon:yes gene_type:complete